MAKPICPHCGGTMRKRSVGNASGCLWGLILICIGIAIFFLIPIFGWVAGPLIGIYGLTRGGKRVLRCRCGYYVPRV